MTVHYSIFAILAALRVCINKMCQSSAGLEDHACNRVSAKVLATSLLQWLVHGQACGALPPCDFDLRQSATPMELRDAANHGVTPSLVCVRHRSGSTWKPVQSLDSTTCGNLLWLSFRAQTLR
uniref:Secreted protein n=1 Tax=Haptolina ericina TaxID=156174 RepID=A0A7S3AYS7_9EUKA|mmetsp:Transcript_42619/g.96353  ORF Transcript_42619/g.96353 Transcript_42619/m.96353 type:complete len:123 (+) Transcript_42619:417-785(+)